MKLPEPGQPGYMRVDHRNALDRANAAVHEMFRDRCNNLGMKSTDSSAGVVAAACADPSLFNVIFHLSRPGSRLALVSLEIKLFPPHTALNASYTLYLLPFMGMPFAVVSLPHSPSCVLAVAGVLKECGLVLADAVPIAVDFPTMVLHGNSRYGEQGWQNLARMGRVHLFPVHGDNSFGTETIAGSRQLDPEEETMLAKATWNEWEIEHGKHTRRQKS